MKSRNLLLLLLVPALSCSRAESPGGLQFPGLKDGWRVLVGRMPPEFLTALEKDGIDGLFREGISLVPETSDRPKGERLFDLRGFFAECGAELPPEASAIYYERDGGLIVIAPEKTVELVETLIPPFHPLADYYPSAAVRVEAMIVGYKVPTSVNIRDLTFDRFREVAGKSWRVLSRMSVVTKSGQRTYALKRVGGGNKKVQSGKLDGFDRAPLLAEHETGSVIEIEPVLSVDGIHIDLNWAFLHREGHGVNARRLESISSLALRDNATAVVASWPTGNALPADDNGVNENLALILHVDLIDAHGIPIREAVLRRLRKTQKAKP